MIAAEQALVGAPCFLQDLDRSIPMAMPAQGGAESKSTLALVSFSGIRLRAISAARSKSRRPVSPESLLGPAAGE